MKFSILLVVLLFLIGCSNNTTSIENCEGTTYIYLKHNAGADPISVFEYDGCEYICVGRGSGKAIAHKGNCKYCQQRAKDR